jgi:Tol biopolymer transport system component
MKGRFTIAVGCACLLLCGLVVSPAIASSPGKNGKIAFQTNRDGNFEIYTVNADGSSPTRLTNVAGDDLAPAWSPDGTKIAFASARDGGGYEIYTMNADGSGQTRLTNNGAVDDAQPSWSPDGTQIAFTTNRDGNFEIYKMNADGTSPVRLTNNAANDSWSSWSPDGTKIAFESNRTGNFEVFTMNADGTSQINRTNNAAIDEYPDWFPDSVQLIFDSNRDGNPELYSMNADGSNVIRQTNAAGSDLVPSISPQNDHVLWMTNRDGNNEIYTSSPQVRVTTNAADDGYPDWQPVNSSFARPRGATPLYVQLVPAYKECTVPTTNHRGAAIPNSSCFNPTPQSTYLTVGTPDYNGVGANFIGSVRISVFCNGGASGEVPPCSTTAGDQLDGKIVMSMADIRCRGATAACPGGALSDYTGQVVFDAGFRITDKNNGPTGVGPSANGTVQDLAVDFAVPCTATAATNVGGTCSITTSIEAQIGGASAITEQKRSIWQLTPSTGSDSDIRVYDGGADGVANTFDNTVFATSGLFFP